MVRRLRLGLTLQTAHKQAWYTRRFLGLRADLTSLPEPAPARIPMTMEPAGPDFKGFDRELARTNGSDWLEIFLRERMLDAGVTTLYVAHDEEREPIYCQWLIGHDDWASLDAYQPGRYVAIAEDEVILANAYTFPRHRGVRAMADGMGQLLRIAAERGATAAYTYVGEDNIPSLRGCHRVGFDLHHVRENTRRLWGRGSTVNAVDTHGRELWHAAIATS